MYSAVENPSELLEKNWNNEGTMLERRSSKTSYARWGAAALVGAAMVSMALATSLRTGTSLNPSNLNTANNDAVEHSAGTTVHAFGKWTLASASLQNAREATEAMWLAFNQYVLVRNQTAWPNYQLVGPTSCNVTERKWSALRFDEGDNNIHWVHDTSRTDPVHGDISVQEMAEYISNLHGDLTGTADQFMDQRYTMAAYEIEPYVHMAFELKEKMGWPVKFYKTNTDTEGAFAWVVQFANKDGQIWETMSINGPSSKKMKDLFTYDKCGFLPSHGLNVTRESCVDRITYADDVTFSSTDTRTAGCFFFEFNDEKFSGDKLGEYILIGKYPRKQELPLTIPWVTHVMSTDPSTDIAFFLKYFGKGTMDGVDEVTDQEITALAQAGTSHSECSYESGWVKLIIDQKMSPDAYLHISYHPEARTGQLKDNSNFGVKEYQEYMTKIRGNMNDNVYDAFMDNHIGLDLAAKDGVSDHFVNISFNLYADGNALLTRREPIPGVGGVSEFWEDGYEKFSTFFYLPVSLQVIQLSVIDVNQQYLIKSGLPEYCDWDFCPEFYNWRAYPDSRTTKGKLTKSTECGYSSL